MGRLGRSVEPVHLTDPADERLDDYRGLRRPDRLSAERGVVVIEGVTVVERVLGTPLAASLRSLVVIPEQFDRVGGTAARLGVPVLVAPRPVLADVAGFDVHRGVLAALPRPAAPDVATVARDASTLVVLEGLNDQENLGAIARSARALGADAILLDPTCADHLARRVVRVSMGEVLWLPVARADPWPATLTRLSGAGVRIFALTPGAEHSLRDVTIAPDQRVAVLAGAEGPGLSSAALAGPVEPVRIPMRPGVDSLNVGHAVAIALAQLGRTAATA